MQQRYLSVLASLALVALLSTAYAQQPASLNTSREELAQQRAQLRAAAATAAAEGGGVRVPERLRGASGPVRVIVELADTPATRVYADTLASGRGEAAARSAEAAQAARITAAQQRFLAAAASLRPTVNHRYGRVYNGVALTLDGASVAALARLPGVKAIHPTRLVTRANASSVGWVGAPEAWSGINGVTGDGIRIAIIDSGIDYFHAGFGGAGKAAFDADDPTIVEPGSFPTAKVVAGTDLVGDGYDPDDPATQAPDPDPVDGLYYQCASGGHGTHVAGSAAGQGVTAAGATYSGPYDNAVDFSSFRVGPGVAPEADLIAVRVFSCESFSTSNDNVIAAVEYSVAQGADVINLSLGSDFGREDEADTVAIENAVEGGTIVVVAAGNAGDTTYIHGGPAAAPSSISVASSRAGGLQYLGIRANGPAAIEDDIFEASEGEFGNEPLSVVGPITDDVALAVPNDACTALTNAATISGKIALVDRGTCNFSTKIANAQAAGAVAVIIANNQDTGVISIGDSTVTGITIPSVFVAKTTGDTLKANLTGLNMTLDHNQLTAPQTQLADTISDFTSRGPSSGTNALKPDLAAPGDTIRSVAAGTGNQSQALSGTSMATPHVAGAMALLRELHPTWTADELKALVMNSAVNNLWVGEDLGLPAYSPARVGTGRLNLERAASLRTLVYGADDPERVSVSFGSLEVLTDTTLTEQITIENNDGAEKSYSLAYVPAATISGVSYTVSPATVTVPANGEVNVTLTMSVDFELLRNTVDPSLTPEISGIPRHWLAESSGYVELYATPPQIFGASLGGASEVPPTPSTNGGTFSFLYDPDTNTLTYNVAFDSSITITASHLHRGAAGANGPVAVNLLGAGTYSGPTNPGVAVLSDADEALLYAGQLYANFHTAAFPGGEIRGQVIPVNTPGQLPDARVGVYATARPASAMAATVDTLGFADATGTGEITLAGTGLDTGVNLPTDILSLVTVFELQRLAGGTSSGPAAEVDLVAVGVNSDFAAAGSVEDSYLYFGLASQEDWSTTNASGFEIWIDTDGSGVDSDGIGAEYILFNTSVANGGDPSDVFVTSLFDLSTGDSTVVDFVNIVGADDASTVPFNTNVMVLSVGAADLGLTTASSRINYRVFGFSAYVGYNDDSGELTYDLAKPGVALDGGANQLLGPVYADLPGTTIPVAYDRANYRANGSLGVLLLHHHNGSGSRVETVLVNPKAYLPLIGR